MTSPRNLLLSESRALTRPDSGADERAIWCKIPPRLQFRTRRGIPVTTPWRLESPAVEPATEAQSAAPVWGAAKRLLFRFAFVYLVLYDLPFPLKVFSQS